MGSLWGESGRYDAFHTLMALLRARLRHPGLPPEQLHSRDPAWRAFVECQAGGGELPTAAAQAVYAAWLEEQSGQSGGSSGAGRGPGAGAAEDGGVAAGGGEVTGAGVAAGEKGSGSKVAVPRLLVPGGLAAWLEKLGLGNAVQPASAAAEPAAAAGPTGASSQLKGPALCTNWRVPAQHAASKKCRTGAIELRRRVGPAGGAACAMASSMAECIRFD